jgi:hypothetical protein
MEESTMSKNTTPALLDALRPTLPEVARSVGVSIWVARTWQQGQYQPKRGHRTKLVRMVRGRAKKLLALAQEVEREGRTRVGGR